MGAQAHSEPAGVPLAMRQLRSLEDIRHRQVLFVCQKMDNDVL
jgi:hypothetical protein